MRPRDSVRLEVHVPPRATVGEPVPISLRLTNTGSTTRTIHLQGRTITFDILVARGRELVWRRLEGEVPQAILRVETLAPGATVELTDTWRQGINQGTAALPGDYTVTGVLPTDAEPIMSPPAPLRIVARQ